MNRKKLLKLSWVTLVIGLALLVITYFFFHFVTDEGITLVWHPEAGKPFVTDLLGMFSVLFLFSSALSALIAWIFTEKSE